MTAIHTSFTWRRAMRQSTLTSTTKLVLYTLADYANAADDNCWPSIERLADDATLSERAVSKHLAIAEEAGWVTRWKSRQKDRRWAHGHYRLTLPEDVARTLRDAIDFELAGSDSTSELASRSAKLPERRSGNAALPAPRSGNFDALPEPRSGNPAGSPEPDSGDGVCAPENAPDDESYLNHVPTNYPVNRNTLTPTLYQPPVVSTGGARAREEVRQERSPASMAQWMFERLRSFDPGFGSVDLRAWTGEIEGMQQVDGRDTDHIAVLFRWATEDGFWRNIITSPQRLRKHWDELRRRRNDAIGRKKQDTQAASTGASAGAPSAGVDRRCAHVDEGGCRCTHTATTIIGAGASRRGYCRQHLGRYDN